MFIDYREDVCPNETSPNETRKCNDSKLFFC